MKKALCLLLLSILYITADAQEKVFSFGPKAGFNLSWMASTVDDPRVGFHAGLLFSLKIHENWRLQPEVCFSQQGGGMFNKVLGPSEYYNYISLPVLARYRFRNRLFFEGGPQLGLLVNKRLRENYGIDGISYVDHHEKTADFLIALGIGFQPGKKFGCNIRYNHGFTTIRTLEGKQNRLLQTGAYMFF